jgi:hypothetical protein
MCWFKQNSLHFSADRCTLKIEAMVKMIPSNLNGSLPFQNSLHVTSQRTTFVGKGFFSWVLVLTLFAGRQGKEMWATDGPKRMSFNEKRVGGRGGSFFEK